MQIVLLGMAMCIFLHDTPEVAPYLAELSLSTLLAVVLLPKAAMTALYGWLCRRAYHDLTAARFRRLNLFSSAWPFILLVLFAGDLWAGLLIAIRGGGGTAMASRDFVLLDELAVMLPTLLAMIAGWWVYYPIDRALRERSIIRRADQGLPIYPVWSRTQYITTQARSQLALIFAPLLLILAWSETVNKLYLTGVIGGHTHLWLIPIGAGVVFLTAPLLIRRLWDTVPLPAGPVRDKMLGLCENHKVRVRELLLWRTYGGTINAAVMGLFAPLRFVLLSDGLIEQVEEDRVEAVMAHELAHVKLKHMLWLLLSAGAALAMLEIVGGFLLDQALPWPQWSGIAMAGVGAVLWVLVFGWVSRRIERQADTFAARHMSRALHDRAPADAPPPTVFGIEAVAAMTGALQRVADLNHIPTIRRSWRHGSIAWRQAYLRTLVDTPLDHAEIDRQMAWINRASLVILGIAFLTEML